MGKDMTRGSLVKVLLLFKIPWRSIICVLPRLLDLRQGFLFYLLKIMAKESFGKCGKRYFHSWSFWERSS